MVTTELLIVSAFKVLAFFVQVLHVTKPISMQHWIHYVNSFFSVAFHCSICYFSNKLFHLSFWLSKFIYWCSNLDFPLALFLLNERYILKFFSFDRRMHFYVLSFHRVCWKSIFLRALLWDLSIFVIMRRPLLLSRKNNRKKFQW